MIELVGLVLGCESNLLNSLAGQDITFTLFVRILGKFTEISFLPYGEHCENINNYSAIVIRVTKLKWDTHEEYIDGLVQDSSNSTANEPGLLQSCIMPLVGKQIVWIHPVNEYDTLEWRHKERDGVSTHQPHDCLFTQPFIQAQIKENIKAPHHLPLCQYRGKCSNLMTSSWKQS